MLFACQFFNILNIIYIGHAAGIPGMPERTNPVTGTDSLRNPGTKVARCLPGGKNTNIINSIKKFGYNSVRKMCSLPKWPGGRQKKVIMQLHYTNNFKNNLSFNYS